MADNTLTKELTIKNTTIRKSNEYLAIKDDTLTNQTTNPTSDCNPTKDEYFALSDATLANQKHSPTTESQPAKTHYLELSNAALSSQPCAPKTTNGSPQSIHKADDDKEGYEDIPDHEYDEMDDSQQTNDSEHALLPEMNVTRNEQKKPSFHRIDSKSENDTSEYMAVTQDMLLPPHKRTIK